MKTKLMIEKMPVAERSTPLKMWQVVKRSCTSRGLSSRDFQCIDRNLTLDRAQAVFKNERRNELR